MFLWYCLHVTSKTSRVLLAAERLKDLCKQLDLAVPVELQTYKPPEVPEYPPPCRLCISLHTRIEKSRRARSSHNSPLAEADINPDIKPPRRLATSYLGKPGLLRMLGSGDEDHIITKVLPGMDPLQEYDQDDPTQIITIDYETDNSSNVDDLSVVSMTSVGSISKEEFQGLLADVAAQHQKMAASVDALVARVKDMTIEQVVVYEKCCKCLCSGDITWRCRQGQVNSLLNPLRCSRAFCWLRPLLKKTLIRRIFNDDLSIHSSTGLRYCLWQRLWFAHCWRFSAAIFPRSLLCTCHTKHWSCHWRLRLNVSLQVTLATDCIVLNPDSMTDILIPSGHGIRPCCFIGVGHETRK